MLQYSGNTKPLAEVNNWMNEQVSIINTNEI